MQTNPFPAVLLAGPPHSGKSVLSYLLTEQLGQARNSHYLLRAAPDGEGNWHLTGPQELVRGLRAENKRGFSPAYVAHMRRAIDNRCMPLIVDGGGRPQGDQFELIGACTHSILLYRDPADYMEWRRHLDRAGLKPLAELRSELEAPDQITQLDPVLTGVIGGLERDGARRRTGATFKALFERAMRVFHYEAVELERLHLAHAPLPALVERELAAGLGIPIDRQIVWEPAHLAMLAECVPPGRPFALYGPGPVWLAAMLAAHALPAPFASFDPRFNWIDIPGVDSQVTGRLEVSYPASALQGHWARLRLSREGVLEPGTLSVPAPPARDGLILSGPLPRWAFAALTRYYSGSQPWVAIDDPARERALVVWSRTGAVPVGAVLPRR